MLFVSNVYSQDIYSRTESISGFEIIYSAKYYYEAESEIAPVLYTGQDGNPYVPSTAVYNPLDLTVTATWDSTSAYTFTLTGLPERMDYSTSNLFTSISSNPRYDHLHYPITVKSGTSIKCAVISNSDGSTEDIFRIIIAIKK